MKENLEVKRENSHLAAVVKRNLEVRKEKPLLLAGKAKEDLSNSERNWEVKRKQSHFLSNCENTFF